MVIKVVKDCSLSLLYEALTDEGKVANRNQKFSFIPEDASDNELFEAGTGIADILAYAYKDIRHTQTFSLVED